MAHSRRSAKASHTLKGAAPVLPSKPVDQDVWDAAIERTRYLFDSFDHVAVSFSGGKDSTATLHVALEVAAERGRLPLRVLHLDEECIPMETEQYVRRVAQRPDVELEWWCLPVKHRNACSRTSPWWWPWAPENEALWARPMPPEALTYKDLPRFPVNPPEARLSWPDISGLLLPPDRYGSAVQLLGIRSEESINRHRMVSRRVEENYIIRTRDEITGWWYAKGYPIYDWRQQDVWTAPARLGWDYNAAYDLMEMAGVSPSQQRCSPAFGEEPLGKLHTFKDCFPDVWDGMTARVPGAATAARYATTELYSYGSRTPKPEGMLWSDWVLQQIDKFQPVDRRRIAARLRNIITRHYSRTAEPILERAPHYVTGVSWQFLFTIASRGDFKERKQEMRPKEGDWQDKAQVRWLAEFAELEAAGRLGEMR